jgi:polysaccharide pyruvyl transferase WcaK-like protein
MKNKVAVIDYWSDYNRGDAMMQVAILQLIDSWPATVALDSGFNEYQKFSSQLDETSSIGDVEFIPSPKFSYYFRGPGKVNNLINKSLLLFNILFVHVFVVLSAMHLGWLLPKSVRKFFNTINDADIVVWNGRNFRSNNKLFELLEFFDLCSSALCAIYMKKKVYALGVSVWEPRTSLGKWLLRAVFSRCEAVYAREDVSLSYIKEKLMPSDSLRVKYLPDLSFYYMENNLSDKKDLRQGDVLTVGIVPKDPVRRNKVSLQEYSNFIVELVKEIVHKKADGKAVRFRFINQAVLENEPNDEAIELIGKGLSGLGEIIDPDRQPSLEGLSETYRQCDYVVSSRMHGCIMSSYLGRPFIGIPYDTGAKWGILERLGPCVLVPMEKITSTSHDMGIMISKSEVFLPASKMNEEAEKIVKIVEGIKGDA